MLLTKSLTISQITFIFRIIIQILAFGGTSLIGLIIFGNSPRSTFKETHDLLNRVLGKSTATLTSVKWMQRQMFQTNDPDRKTPKSLLFGLLLFVLYGLFVSLSDIGFLGLHACDIPFPPFDTYPASVQTEADARSLVQKNLVSGTDPKLVKFSQCGLFNSNVSSTPQICPQWRNTTYDDPSLFRSLNLTDSDVIMHKTLGVSTGDIPGLFYHFGPSNHVVSEPTISDGLAILPHETGVQMVVGAPTLSKNQAVNIPKTMALEIEVGCLPVGLVGNNGLFFHHEFSAVYEWFIPDSIYKPIQRSTFFGPEHLFGPLQTAADAIRNVFRPDFNTSIIHPDTGYIRSYNKTSSKDSWPTVVGGWFVYWGSNRSILDDCTARVHRALNASMLSHSGQGFRGCFGYQLRGTVAKGGDVYEAHDNMVCATTTAVNMVSADLEMDTDGRVGGRLSRLTSDLNINVWSKVQRYTLSDSPSGDLQHYIFQQHSPTYPYASTITPESSGSPGYSLSQVGPQAVGRFDPWITEIFILNSTFFSWSQSNATTLTKWIGGYTASWLLTSFGMNGWAALDKPSLTIRSTGGRPAVCYSAPYLAAFIPLIVAALVVIFWRIQLWSSSRLRDARKWEKLYGGLVPSVGLIGTRSSDTIFEWEADDAEMYLRPLKDDDDSGGSEH